MGVGRKKDEEKEAKGSGWYAGCEALLGPSKQKLFKKTYGSF